MKKLDMSKFIYVLIMIMVFITSQVFSQIKVVHFNAGWNEANGAKWFMDLKDCKTKSIVDISKQTDVAKQHKIAVVPTIIIFKDDEEVARFQADLSFKMVATREEVQEEIDNIIMSDF